MALELLDRPAEAAPAALPTSAARRTKTARVLHIINGDHYAGAERVQDLLALRLGEMGFDVSFALLKEGAFADARMARQARLYETPMSGRADWRTVRRIANIVRQDGYALVHAHTARSAVVGRLAAALAGVPMVYHVHSPTIRNTTRRLGNWVNAIAERASLVGVPRLIAVSHSLAAHMRSLGIPRSRVCVVHNGVPGPARLAKRSPPGATWTLGCVALYRPRKGLEVLLDAIGLLRSFGHEVRLRAVGRFETPKYESQIAARVERLGIGAAIEWTGFTRDVPGELARMDLFVLPSLFGEGLPMVVLEAMAHGVPVVATRVEGVPEAITDGLEGLLAAPGEAADLAAVIRRVIDGGAIWQALREAAFRRHGAEFSDTAMAAGVAEVYRDVLGWGRD